MELVDASFMTLVLKDPHLGLGLREIINLVLLDTGESGDLEVSVQCGKIFAHVLFFYSAVI